MTILSKLTISACFLVCLLCACGPAVKEEARAVKFKGVYVYPPYTQSVDGYSRTNFVFFRFYPDGTCAAFGAPYIAPDSIEHAIGNEPFLSGTYVVKDGRVEGSVRNEDLSFDLNSGKDDYQIVAQARLGNQDAGPVRPLRYREYVPLEEIHAVLDGHKIAAKIMLDDHEARLILDTGAPRGISVFGSWVRKTGLKLYTGKKFDYILAELGTGMKKTVYLRVPVDEVPFRGDVHGIIGWFILRRCKWRFDWDKGEVLPVAEIPEDVQKWKSWDLAEEHGYPVITFEQGGKPGRILVDTGWGSGFVLSRARWPAWYDEKPRPLSIDGGFSPATDGIRVAKECWAEEISLGPVKLRNIAVTQSQLFPELDEYFDGLMSMEALSRFDLYLDGPGLKIHYRERETPGLESAFNKAGVVFMPKDLDSTRLFANVLFRSVAWKAGIRGGDEILAADGKLIGDWREILAGGQYLRWAQPAGTKYVLTIMRGGTKMDIELVLPEIADMPTSVGETEPPVPAEEPAWEDSTNQSIIIIE